MGKFSAQLLKRGTLATLLALGSAFALGCGDDGGNASDGGAQSNADAAPLPEASCDAPPKADVSSPTTTIGGIAGCGATQGDGPEPASESQEVGIAGCGATQGDGPEPASESQEVGIAPGVLGRAAGTAIANWKGDDDRLAHAATLAPSLA